MGIREVVTAFTAMSAGGQAYRIPHLAMLSSFADGSGFKGRTDDGASLASFVYVGTVYYASKDTVELNTREMVFTSRRH